MNKLSNFSLFANNLSRYCCLIGCMVCSITVTLHAQLEELPLKAFFLEAAVRFIAWPEDTAVSKSKDFTIANFPDDNFTPHLRVLFAKKQIKGKNVKFKTIRKLDDIDSCFILIIPSGKKNDLTDILSTVAGKPILTVCESPEFAKKGVMLCISSENRKVSCYINNQEALASRLKISHHLLQKAQVITSSEHKR